MTINTFFHKIKKYRHHQISLNELISDLMICSAQLHSEAVKSYNDKHFRELVGSLELINAVQIYEERELTEEEKEEISAILAQIENYLNEVKSKI